MVKTILMCHLIGAFWACGLATLWLLLLCLLTPVIRHLTDG